MKTKIKKRAARPNPAILAAVVKRIVEVADPEKSVRCCGTLSRPCHVS